MDEPARERLRILITNNHLFRVGGSETWTHTMAHVLAEDHDVEVFTLEPGEFAETFSVPVITEVTSEYDLALVNHNTCLEALADSLMPKILTCHGTWPWQEQPAPGADAYVAISEEVQAHLGDLGYESVVVRNGIDCERFAPRTPARPELTRVLSVCQGEAARDAVRDACERRGIEFDYLHHDRMLPEVEEYMDAADLVVGLGRSAYEGMAAGRAVLVYDSREYSAHATDGLVTSENVEELLRCNLSGRASAAEMTPELMDAYFDAYDAAMGAFNRAFALEHLNARLQAERYLALYDAIVSGATEPDRLAQ